MDTELLLADMVRRWADGVLPGQTAIADRAVAAALECLAGGGSMSEACEEARRLVGSCVRHPSQSRQPCTRLRRAS